MKRQKWLKVKSAAEVFEISKHTLYGWIYQQRVEAEKVGGSWRVNPDSLGRKEIMRMGRVVVNLLALKEGLSQAQKTVAALISFEKRKRKANLRIIQNKGVEK